MDIQAGQRVKQLSTTTGTGVIQFLSIVPGFRSFVEEIGTGKDCFYWLIDANGLAWECGIGLVTAGSPDTLTRTTILRSSNSNAAISLSTGTHTLVNNVVEGYLHGDMECLGLKISNANIVAPQGVLALNNHFQGL